MSLFKNKLIEFCLNHKQYIHLIIYSLLLGIISGIFQNYENFVTIIAKTVLSSETLLTLFFSYCLLAFFNYFFWAYRNFENHEEFKKSAFAYQFYDFTQTIAQLLVSFISTIFGYILGMCIYECIFSKESNINISIFLLLAYLFIIRVFVYYFDNMNTRIWQRFLSKISWS